MKCKGYFINSYLIKRCKDKYFSQTLKLLSAYISLCLVPLPAAEQEALKGILIMRFFS
jgi:hypothetical protein